MSLLHKRVRVTTGARGEGTVVKRILTETWLVDFGGVSGLYTSDQLEVIGAGKTPSAPTERLETPPPGGAPTGISPGPPRTPGGAIHNTSTYIPHDSPDTRGGGIDVGGGALDLGGTE